MLALGITGRRSFFVSLALGLVVSACTLEDRVLGDDLRGFVDNGKIDFDYGPLAPNGCDLSGRWIAEQETYNSVLVSGVAVARNWFYYEIEDEGDTFTVTRGWDCGLETTGITSVAIFPETTKALALRNRQDGVLDATVEPERRVAPRTGIYRPSRDTSQCEFSMERWWWMRGAELRYLPSRDDYASADIPDMEAASPLPTRKAPDGNEDWDGDGKPGITLEVFKPLRGQRHVVQRDWNELGPFLVPDGASRFFGPISFNNQETVIEASSPLLAAGSKPSDEGHSIRFLRVDEEAPLDIDAFVPWCQKKVADVFASIRKSEEGSL